MDRRNFLRHGSLWLLAAGASAELIERLTWTRKFFPGADFVPPKYFIELAYGLGAKDRSMAGSVIREYGRFGDRGVVFTQELNPHIEWENARTDLPPDADRVFWLGWQQHVIAQDGHARVRVLRDQTVIAERKIETPRHQWTQVAVSVQVRNGLPISIQTLQRPPGVQMVQASLHPQLGDPDYIASVIRGS